MLPPNVFADSHWNFADLPVFCASPVQEKGAETRVSAPDYSPSFTNGRGAHGRDARSNGRCGHSDRCGPNDRHVPNDRQSRIQPRLPVADKSERHRRVPPGNTRALRGHTPSAPELDKLALEFRKRAPEFGKPEPALGKPEPAFGKPEPAG
jgi:hypothetical protein